MAERVRLLWVQCEEATWLEFAMDDESIAQDARRWEEGKTEARRVAAENGGELREQIVNVPGVFEMFEVPEVEAAPDAH